MLLRSTPPIQDKMGVTVLALLLTGMLALVSGGPLARQTNDIQLDSVRSDELTDQLATRVGARRDEISKVERSKHSEAASSGRNFPGLPVPLQPFIDFYETYPDPAVFYPLSGTPGTIAFVIFSLLLLLTNAGFLPINIQDRINDYDDYEDPEPVGLAALAAGRRGLAAVSRSSQEPSGGLRQCLPLVLCPLERATGLHLFQTVPADIGTEQRQRTKWSQRRREISAYNQNSVFNGETQKRRSCRQFEDRCSGSLAQGADEYVHQ